MAHLVPHFTSPPLTLYRSSSLAKWQHAETHSSLSSLRDALSDRNHLYLSVTGDGGQYFRIRPSNSSVLEGGEVIIPCEVGNRVGTVQWVKDGFAYVIQQSKFDKLKYKLSFLPASALFSEAVIKFTSMLFTGRYLLNEDTDAI